MTRDEIWSAAVAFADAYMRDAGRKLLSADYQAGPTPSELYATQSDWRR